MNSPTEGSETVTAPASAYGSAQIGNGANAPAVPAQGSANISQAAAAQPVVQNPNADATHLQQWEQDYIALTYLKDWSGFETRAEFAQHMENVFKYGNSGAGTIHGRSGPQQVPLRSKSRIVGFLHRAAQSGNWSNCKDWAQQGMATHKDGSKIQGSLTIAEREGAIRPMQHADVHAPQQQPPPQAQNDDVSMTDASVAWNTSGLSAMSPIAMRVTGANLGVSLADELRRVQNLQQNPVQNPAGAPILQQRIPAGVPQIPMTPDAVIDNAQAPAMQSEPVYGPYKMTQAAREAFEATYAEDFDEATRAAHKDEAMSLMKWNPSWPQLATHFDDKIAPGVGAAFIDACAKAGHLGDQATLRFNSTNNEFDSKIRAQTHAHTRGHSRPATSTTEDHFAPISVQERYGSGPEAARLNAERMRRHSDSQAEIDHQADIKAIAMQRLREEEIQAEMAKQRKEKQHVQVVSPNASAHLSAEGVNALADVTTGLDPEYDAVSRISGLTLRTNGDAVGGKIEPKKFDMAKAVASAPTRQQTIIRSQIKWGQLRAQKYPGESSETRFDIWKQEQSDEFQEELNEAYVQSPVKDAGGNYKRNEDGSVMKDGKDRLLTNWEDWILYLRGSLKQVEKDHMEFARRADKKALYDPDTWRLKKNATPIDREQRIQKWSHKYNTFRAKYYPEMPVDDKEKGRDLIDVLDLDLVTILDDIDTVSFAKITAKASLLSAAAHYGDKPPPNYAQNSGGSGSQCTSCGKNVKLPCIQCNFIAPNKPVPDNVINDGIRRHYGIAPGESLVSARGKEFWKKNPKGRSTQSQFANSTTKADQRHASKDKDTPCRNMARHGKCSYGDKCRFSHTLGRAEFQKNAKGRGKGSNHGGQTNNVTTGITDDDAKKIASYIQQQHAPAGYMQQQQPQQPQQQFQQSNTAWMQNNGGGGGTHLQQSPSGVLALQNQ